MDRLDPNTPQVFGVLQDGLVHAGGITGIVLAALAAYLSASAVCEASYGRDVLPVGDLSRR